MKKLVLIFVLLYYSLCVHAGGGIWEYYLNIGGSWYGNIGNPTLSGAVLATGLDLNTNDLNLGTRGINTWNDNGCDVTAGNLNYRVYKQGDTPPSFIPVSLSYQGVSGNNKFWNNDSPQINLLTGLTETGTYIFEVYFDAPTNGAGDCPSVLYENNGGGNFIATFTVAVPLPIKYANLQVSNLDRNQNQISWSTLSEVNNDYFEVQHSIDGRNYVVIGMVEGSGNSNQEKHYYFIHKYPSKNLAYYRLKQVDFDGKYEFSPILSVDLASSDDVGIYPNPTQGILQINGLDLESKITIYDFSGKVIKVFENTEEQSINIQDLQTRIYLVSILNNSKSHHFRLVKE